MKKLYLFLCALLVPVFLQAIDNQQDFIVGMTSGYAPYVSLSDKGEYEGFDIDLAEKLAAKLGRKLVLKDLGCMPSLLVALKQKKIDAVIWAVSITEERQKVMSLIYYQGEPLQAAPFLFWGTVPEGISELSDLKGRVVAVEAGSYQEVVVKTIPEVRLKYVDKMMDAVMEIKYGKSFTTVVDSSLIKRLTGQFPDLKVVSLPLPPELRELGNGIALNKESLLAAPIQKAIDEMRADGTIAALEAKWKLS